MLVAFPINFNIEMLRERERGVEKEVLSKEIKKKMAKKMK